MGWDGGKEPAIFVVVNSYSGRRRSINLMILMDVLPTNHWFLWYFCMRHHIYTPTYHLILGSKSLGHTWLDSSTRTRWIWPLVSQNCSCSPSASGCSGQFWGSPWKGRGVAHHDNCWPRSKLSSNIDGISTSGRLRILVNKDHCVPHLSVNGFGTTVAYCSWQGFVWNIRMGGEHFPRNFNDIQSNRVTKLPVFLSFDVPEATN